MGFEPTEHLRVRRFSRPDPSTARTSLHIDFSIIWTFLEFLLDMLFLKHREVCEKPDSIRVFGALASEMLSTFQDRLVMTTSICLHRILRRSYDITFLRSCQYPRALLRVPRARNGGAAAGRFQKK